MDTTLAIEQWIFSQAIEGYTYGYDVGRVYARVWKRLGNQTSRSAVAFVELSTGRIRRADSWKKPGMWFDATVFSVEGA